MGEQEENWEKGKKGTNWDNIPAMFSCFNGKRKQSCTFLVLFSK